MKKIQKMANDYCDEQAKSYGNSEEWVMPYRFIGFELAFEAGFRKARAMALKCVRDKQDIESAIFFLGEDEVKE